MPKTEIIKLSFACPAYLDRYAALHAQAYGEAVDVMALIPHMLDVFRLGSGILQWAGRKSQDSGGIR
ncbi:DUF2274 domain-containing protein [Achromobacter sp. ACM05]|nr:DUF2274 domain-containing protein [Achromobacter sp. ACM05]MBV7502875.1 DUF2274 domain-containing protein [Achromobacter sp. ACM05]